MILNSGKIEETVLWSELFPHAFNRRIEACPIVYLPLGICEPHGQFSAFGLDTMKAEWLCAMAASRVGGIVAPTQAYHIHETGYHARWLEEVVGEENPRMTSMPPHVVLQFFLYQLRAFVNAGFKAIVVVSGHSGGNQEDLRIAAELFMEITSVQVWVVSDPELVHGQYTGDHAGKYEISQLMYLRPELVDLSLIRLEQLPGSGGKLAAGADAGNASPVEGERIMLACLDALQRKAKAMQEEAADLPPQPRIPLSEVEVVCQRLLAKQASWVTLSSRAGQEPVSEESQWKIPYLPI
ncbi:creatininase family protein [Paenibacillus roseipurpureus]|uniref:Creatininase family protein n=1 Tax=Paenibacillus roseopurpureus TaxID=2918901 RepID=A0AA96LQ64_9BACL|nr:creatininase family protein [Paenibacillus sp. MBLB1832]WNR42850.1 creatininase family protein [Paenibacillus sp. MBLB1832]